MPLWLEARVGDVTCKHPRRRLGEHTLSSAGLVRAHSLAFRLGIAPRARTCLRRILAPFLDYGKILHAAITRNFWVICVGDRDIGSMSRGEPVQAVGYVCQQATLFQGMIRENLTLGRDISDYEMVRGCIRANVHQDILAMPDEYDPVVGEEGVRLSEGSASASASLGPWLRRRHYSCPTSRRPRSTLLRKQLSRRPSTSSRTCRW